MNLNKRTSVSGYTDKNNMDFESLFAHVPVPMAVISPVGEIILVNKNFCALLGYSEEHLVNSSISVYIRKTERPSYCEDVKKLMAGEHDKFETVLNIEIKSGEFIQVNYKASLVSDEKGQPLYQIVTIEMATNENMYLEALMSSFPGLIYFKDLDSKFLKVNQAYTEKFNVDTPEDIIGKSDFDFFDPSHASRAYNDEQKIIKTGQPLLNTEEKETWPDGHHSWVSTTKMPLHNKNGEIVGTYGISSEITERREGELKLQEKRSILNAITSRMPVVIYKYQVNRGLEVIMGAEHNQKSFKDSKVVKLNIADGLSTLIDNISEDRDKYGYLHFNSTTDVQHFENFVFKSQSIEDEYIGLALDVTDNKQSRQKIKKNAKALEKINRELNQFAYIISHDLKAPLRAITNLSSWIEEDLGEVENEEVKENLRLLRNRVSRMENLINGILAYSRVSRAEVEYEEVDVKQVIKEVIDSLMVPDKFEVNLSDNLPKINFPRVNLEQIFSNLISNAVKYHDKPAGKIEIGYKEKNSFHEFWVKDDGPGISPEYHEKVFVIFQTLQARDSMESTGIGLTIVKKIIEDKGGTIKIESEVGEGTTFVFNIPKSTEDNGNQDTNE